MATPDAIVRVSADHPAEANILQTYFLEQEHSSIVDLIQRLPQQSSSILLQVCT